MTWNQIRSHFPRQWLLIEATQAHTEESRRILEDLAVVDCFADGQAAMRQYTATHRREPQRELYVLHTDRESIEITELNWTGLREAS